MAVIPTLEFNGVSIDELGLISQAIPSYEFPKKNYTYTHIPGRNGDLITDAKSYANTERTYYLACVYEQGTDFKQNASKIVSWLMNAKGYCVLRDKYEPDVFRLASYVNNGSLTDIYETATTLNVTFNCRPQRYLNSGAQEQNITSNPITNPTVFESLPIIRFVPKENGTLKLTVGDNVITIVIEDLQINNETVSMVDKPIYIDSEIQHCYMVNNNQKININKQVTLSEFPVLKAGDTTITFEDVNCEPKKITPRWWKL